MNLHEVVPWGRTREEYRRMFNLTDSDLAKRILGVGDGPASFNAEMTEGGYNVTSIDPIYAFSAEQLADRVNDTYQTVIEQMHKNALQYNWSDFEDVDDLGSKRMKAMNRFLTDYEIGRKQGRYQAVSLPQLPFADRSFDLAVCSHLLFLYSDQLSEAFHLESIRELIRVAREVRIFPLISLKGQLSNHLNSVLEDCQQKNIQAEIVHVNYHFQKGAFQMLRLSYVETRPFASHDRKVNC